jgi:hypothetical protein
MFVPHHTECGRAEAHEYLPAAAITPKIGLALYQSSGKLAVASGTTKPTYICMCEKSAAVTAGTIIPVIRVEPDMVFETISSAAMTSINLGDKVTIASDGLRVTATTTSGVAEVVAIDDTASGGTVRVRF